MNKQLSKARVAIVHEFSTGYVGSEKVVEQILLLFPKAELFFVADFLSADDRTWLKGRVPKTSFIQRLPLAKRYYRSYLPLMPLAVEGLDLTNFDIVISSSHAIAKGVLTGPDQLHICYCHTPIRYAWDLQHQYLRESGMTKGLKRILTRVVLHYMRLWDTRTSNGVDLFVSNSSYIARRIKKVYGRNSTVIYPPVDIEYFKPGMPSDRGEYYITASRLVPYKKIETIVEAFTKIGNRELFVIGAGPHLQKCRSIAGPNVRILGYQPKEVLLKLMQRAKAFVFAAEEDFGISVVEAQACGLPVICFGKGGATESILDGKTGLFFSEQTPESIVSAVLNFEACQTQFSCDQIRRNAERFGADIFRREFLQLVKNEYENRINFDSAEDGVLLSSASH